MPDYGSDSDDDSLILFDESFYESLRNLKMTIS
jgi:hypothetical protein